MLKAKKPNVHAWKAYYPISEIQKSFPTTAIPLALQCSGHLGFSAHPLGPCDHSHYDLSSTQNIHSGMRPPEYRVLMKVVLKTKR